METTLKPENHDITVRPHTIFLSTHSTSRCQSSGIIVFRVFNFLNSLAGSTQSPPVKHYCCQRWLKNASDHWTLISSHSTMYKINIMANGIGVPDAIIGYQAAVHVACEQQNGR
ncbi:hypothetical protein T02_12440 [Trichinella nativa]|uniref:Uncharacterized protein n=1 Tax=Trichinella nativa TaxID=6335 RepID=A0A0V1KV32_9BILA|nr:hypothetical protein T02_12440 [Trichinella nativa]